MCDDVLLCDDVLMCDDSSQVKSSTIWEQTP
jgi:hypothetical protein